MAEEPSARAGGFSYAVGEFEGCAASATGQTLRARSTARLRRVATVAAAGLNGEAVHHADDEQRESRNVGGGGKVAFAAGALEAVAHLGDAALADSCHLLADGFAFGAGDECALDPEAAAGIGVVGGHRNGAAEQHLRDLAGARLAKCSADVAAGAGAVACDRLAKEAGLVAERGVKAGAVDAHGGGERGERSAFVALLPEHPHSGVEGLIAIEGARATGLGLSGEGWYRNVWRGRCRKTHTQRW